LSPEHIAKELTNELGGAEKRLQLSGVPGTPLHVIIVCPVLLPDTSQPALEESGVVPLRITVENDDPSEASTEGTITGTNAPAGVGRETVALPVSSAAPTPPNAQHATGELAAVSTAKFNKMTHRIVMESS
jgi:hypothetical protein